MKTGKIVAKHMYASQVAGLTVAPSLVENQMSGALIMGTSRALYEAVVFDKGRVTSLDWVTYPLLRIKDSPNVTTVPVQRLDLQPTGSGEPPTAASAAAIANAFFDATGVRLHEAPMTSGTSSAQRSRLRASLSSYDPEGSDDRVRSLRSFLDSAEWSRSRLRPTRSAPNWCRARSSPTALPRSLGRDGRTILSYGPAAGYTPLRELIGQWFAVHPSRVVLTNGSLQGLALLAQRVVGGGRNVVAEYPIHDRAEKVLLTAGASLLGAPMDEEGMVVDELHNMLSQYATPALIYTIPSFHNPTGWTMSLTRRRRAVELVQGQGLVQLQDMLLFEDDSYALTRFEGEREPALFDLSRQRSLYSSSFSPTIAPGLRVGWLVLPEAIADELGEVASGTYITPSLLSQATVYEFIRRGSFEPHLARLRGALKLRRDAMLAALEQHMPDGKWSRPEGGFFVWLELPGSPDGRAVLERAQGVSAVPGTAFAAMSSFLRLSYSFAPPDEIDAGIQRLAAALR